MTQPFGGSHSFQDEIVAFDIAARDVEAAEVVSMFLWDLGVKGIEEIQHSEGVVLLRSSFGLGRIETEKTLREMLDTIDSRFGAGAWKKSIESFGTSLVDSSVCEGWRAFAQPVSISARMEVVPSWIERQRLDSTNSATISLLIDPGCTFGMGDHPTTRASLLMLERVVQPDSRVLDVGCGSGILGIASLLLGARHARGLDIDPAAVPVSHSNAQRNGVDSKWSASLEPFCNIDDEFDVVCANILAPTLIELAQDLKRVLDANGVLIVSGVLSDAYDHVLQALEPLEIIDSIHIEGWSAIALKRRSG